jgi:hypothetical protein
MVLDGEYLDCLIRNVIKKTKTGRHLKNVIQASTRGSSPERKRRTGSPRQTGDE